MKPRPLLPVAMIALCLWLPACATSSHPPRDTGAPCGAPRFAAPFDHIDGCSAEHVAVAAVTAMFTYRPSAEVDQRVAFRRAAPLLAPDYARRAEHSAVALAPVTAALWQQWAAAGVTVTATARVTGDDHPVDTATRAARVLAVTLVPDDLGAPIPLTVYTHLRRPNPAAAWRVSALEVAS
ncbi:hypothetical protein [Nocardia wallacei]|uniref:hypothetical protein n=1 Tax=Nocardia wallacei TaxID=480035 RepID=UPI0024581681|nr:hypothetical protein [Nocardia wallacei]